ncbi:hypothetical protein EAF04_009120 [Stromatinia cepivora]|nr:hypothetical protein EAF04_009120 [Stromatinia cepivora]
MIFFSMSLQIQEVTTAVEFAEVVKVQADAFDSPINVSSRMFYPVLGNGPTARLDAVKGLIARQWYRHSVDDCSHWLKVADSNLGGKVVGGGCWRIVQTHEKPMAIDPWWLPEGEKRKYSEMVFAQWAAIKGEERGPHLAIQVVFSDPDHRQRGIGSLVID